METSQSNYNLIPTFGNSFGTGWKVMLDNFLRLFLVVIVLAILAIPLKFHYSFDASDFNGGPWEWAMDGHWHKFFGMASLGILASFVAFLSLLYTFLVRPVVKYGGKMIFVQAVRKMKPDFELLIKGFWENYLHIILANLLVVALIVLGLFALIVPGIIISLLSLPI